LLLLVGVAVLQAAGVGEVAGEVVVGVRVVAVVTVTVER
jgi:hypothetical protein